jgi:hypothetical protein
MRWADAERLHQAAREIEAARELDGHGRDVAALRNYHNKLIVAAAVSGAEDAEIARAAAITCRAAKRSSCCRPTSSSCALFRPSER